MDRSSHMKSDHGNEKKPVKDITKGPKKVMYLFKVKQGVEWYNLLSLFMVPMIAACCSSYATSQMTFLLTDKRYFGIDKSLLGRTNSELNIWSQTFALVFTPFFGYLYDIAGRRLVMIPATVGTAAIIVLFPLVAPFFWALVLVKCLLSLLVSILCVTPLMADYVEIESLGVATALVIYGSMCGELLMVVLMQATATLTHTIAYAVVATSMFFLSTVLILMIREPNLGVSDLTKARSEKEKSAEKLQRKQKE